MQHSRAQTLRSCAFKSNCVVNVTQSVPRPESPCVCLRRRPNNLLPGKAQSDLVRPSKREKRRRGEGQPDAIPRAVYAVCGFLPHPPLRTKLETSARSGSWIQQPLPFSFFLSFFLFLFPLIISFETYFASTTRRSWTGDLVYLFGQLSSLKRYPSVYSRLLARRSNVYSTRSLFRSSELSFNASSGRTGSCSPNKHR